MYFSQFWRPEVQDQGAGLGGSGESPLRGADFPLLVFLHGGTRATELFGVLFTRGLIPFTKAPLL